jgi:hypothetical protein
MEMQRHGLLMYTSCGWFFDDISGLETTQCLRYAARAIQLAKHFDHDFEDEFVRGLEKAPSNLPQYANGRAVWERLVQPLRVNLDRVLAHHAISLIYRAAQAQTRLYCYELESLDQEVHRRGANHVAIGRLQVHSRLTWNRAEASFVVIHYGGLDFHTVLRRRGCSAEEYEEFKKRLRDTYQRGSLADVTALVAREFEGSVHRLEDLFTEEQRRVIGIVLQNRFEDYRLTFERLATQDGDVLNRLGQMRYPIPKPLQAAASCYLDTALRHQIVALETDGSLARVQEFYEWGQAWGYQPERELLAKTLAESLQRLLGGIGPEMDLPALMAQAVQILDVAALLGITLDLWEAQNQLLDTYAQREQLGRVDQPLREAFAELAHRIGIRPGLLGWHP